MLPITYQTSVHGCTLQVKYVLGYDLISIIIIHLYSAFYIKCVLRAERNSDSDLDLLMERGRQFQTNGAIFLKDRVVATTGSREFDERKAGRYNSLRSDKYLGAEPLRELTVGIAA